MSLLGTLSSIFHVALKHVSGAKMWFLFYQMPSHHTSGRLISAYLVPGGARDRASPGGVIIKLLEHVLESHSRKQAVLLVEGELCSASTNQTAGFRARDSSTCSKSFIIKGPGLQINCVFWTNSLYISLIFQVWCSLESLR